MATEAGTQQQAAPLRARRVSTPRAVLLVAVLGSSLAAADASSVNIAIPNIAQDFPGAPLSSVSWVLNAYNIVFAAFLIGGGQLADLLGRRRVFSVGLFVFAAASALCAISTSLTMLVAARVLEAAGGAMLVPSALAIVLEAHQAHDRVHAVALGSAVAALAAGLGPPVGGALITVSSWRLVFVVNVGLSVVVLLLARRVLVESRAPGRRRLPDLLGGVVLACAIASLVLAILKGAEWGWGNARVLGALLAAAALAAWFALRTTRARTPIVDPALLRIRDFRLSNAAALVLAGGFFAYALCNVLFLTEVWNYSILDAGLALTPEPFIAMALASPTIHLVRRIGHRPVMVAGALVWAAGVAYFALALGSSPDFLGGWLPGMIILGVGSGLTFPTLSGVAVGSVPGPRFAIATSLNSVATQVGAALGVAVLIAIVGESHLRTVFEQGWLFSAGCFVIGAGTCLALHASEEDELAQTTAAAPAPPDSEEREWARVSRLPSLAEATGEQAAVSAQSDAEFLRNVHIFASLPQPLLERVAALATDVSLRRGEWLFRQGDPPEGVYVVRVGHLEVYSEGSEMQAINTLTRGAVLGELALLSGSARSASIRALRDTEILKIDKAHFDALIRAEPELALALTRALSHQLQLQASRVVRVEKRPRPVTIALHASGAQVPLTELADELSRAMCLRGNVAVVHAGTSSTAAADESSRAETAARFGPLIEQCERDHDQVLMLCGENPEPTPWDEFCLSRADRILAVVAGPIPEPGSPERDAAVARLSGADLVGYGIRTGSGELAGWVDALRPPATFAVGAGDTQRADVRRLARRLSGHSLGVVLAGAGARAFAHLGVLEVLLDAGAPVDRVAGVSMGAFVGGLLAQGYDSASIDACCYEEWVRRNPLNDYTVPRASLIKGHKLQAMLERVFGDARIEELARSFYCASSDLGTGRLVVDRHGALARAVAASITLPLIAPPARREDALLVDGSLLDNLPVRPMSEAGEGPVLAIDIADAEEPADAGAAEAARQRRRHRLPPLTETMARLALLSSANTDESTSRYADMTVKVPLAGVGLLEFHQIDAARDAGRRAAQAALESAPEWLLGTASVAGRESSSRTVIRV